MSLCGSSFSEEAKTANWPQWRGPGRDAVSPDTGLLQSWEAAKPRLLWMAEGLGKGFASVSVADGVVYSTGNSDGAQVVVAVNAADGKIKWSTPITEETPKHGYEGSRSTPAIDGDRCYVVASSGAIVCLDTADGKVVWRKEFKSQWQGRMMSGWGFAESPLVDGDLVLCTPGGKDATIVALKKLTGEQVWAAAVPEFEGAASRSGAAYSSIVISNACGVKQYVQLLGSGVVGVRASDGKFLWGYGGVANRTANIPTAIVDGDHVFASTGYGAGAALLKLSASDDGVDAEEVYFLNGKTFQNHHGGMVQVGDYIYCGHGHNNGFPACLNWKTGKLAWGGDIRGIGKGSAAVVYADGNVMFRYQSGEVALIEANPKEYVLKGSFMPEYQESRSWSHPVVINGKLYLREQNKLMCYDATPPGE